MLLADTVSVRTTVVAGAGMLWTTPHPPRRSRHGSSLRPSRRIHQFFVGRGERGDSGRQGQVGGRELLEHGCVIGRREGQVVECHL